MQILTQLPEDNDLPIGNANSCRLVWPASARLENPGKACIEGAVPGFFPRKKLKAHPTSPHAAFDRLKKRDLRFATAIDVGASNGCWSVEMMKLFPDVHYHCIEAQQSHASALKKMTGAHKNLTHVIAAAGDKEGTVYFEVEDLFGGRASAQKEHAKQTAVPMTTVDIQVREFSLKPPFLIKLDTHGYEWPILQGAAETLGRTEALIIEMYNFSSGEPMLRFYDLCQRLGGLGFRPVDMCDFLYRPSDGFLWQFDVILLRKDRPEFRNLTFA
jgi:FkbM family methyltransferase